MRRFEACRGPRKRCPKPVIGDFAVDRVFVYGQTNAGAGNHLPTSGSRRRSGAARERSMSALADPDSMMLFLARYRTRRTVPFEGSER